MSENLAMLPIYFDYVFVHLRQKSTSQARIKPEMFVNFRPEPARDRPEKPGPTYNSATGCFPQIGSSGMVETMNKKQ